MTIHDLTIEQMREIVAGAPDGVIHYVDKGVKLNLNTLRTAIAKHDNTDHVTDIRNHVSPSTNVVDL